MEDQFIIGFKQDKAFLTPGKALTLEQAGLPAFAKSFEAEAFLIIRILDFSLSEKRMHAEIILYQNGAIQFPPHQLQLADKFRCIEKVTFRTSDTFALLRILKGGGPSGISPKIEPRVTRHEPEKINTQETFFIPLKHVRFKLGGVSFEKKLKDFGNTHEFTIANPDIREEFDAIKNYFVNVLKTKQIRVVATIQIVNGHVRVINAISEEIEKIDKQLIEDVKIEAVKQMTKKKGSTEAGKNLLTIEEYFEAFTDGKLKSTTFYKDDKELIEDLIKITKSKHYNHLRFLSSKHLHDGTKLRFVHNPSSFVFLLAGTRNYHIIWETLDTSEATYIWHIDQDTSILETTLKEIDKVIGKIKSQGRRHYISEAEDTFQRIFHDYSDTAGGFVKWKSDLEKMLT